MIKTRGCLTEEITELALVFLQRDITTKELRLYPFLCVNMLDRKSINTALINKEEIAIINTLIEEGHLILGTPFKLHPTREFYMFMQSVLMEGYVVTAEDLEL